tara:strand:- start:5348 stop:10099 length:4752 start_codon:yes stop_codon:yes gene_type:complete
MPLVKSAATSLAQGVSQQAESQRYASQATEQINAYSSHIKGLVKRPPIKHVSSIGVNASTGTESFMHLMYRDDNEQYAVVVNNGTETRITGVDLTTARDWDGSGNAANITGSITYTHASDLFAVNDAVQFTRTELGDRFPTGIHEGETYYVHSFGNTNNNRWFILKTTTATSTATNYLTVGHVELTAAALGTVGDEYKAGLLIESVRNADGSWVDGVLTTRFSSPASGTGHSFANGNYINIRNLQGTSAYILANNELVELSQPAKTMGGTNLRANEIASKFWLKNAESLAVKATNFGYRVDGDQLLRIDEYVQRFDEGESVSDYVDFYSTETTFNPDGNELTKVQGSFDVTTLPVGSLIRVGDNPNNPRAIVTAVSSTVITLAEGIDSLWDLGADDGNGNYTVYYWANPKNTSKFRNISQNDYRETNDFAYVGDDGGTCSVTHSEKGTGPYVTDLKTGSTYPVVPDNTYGNPYNYLLQVNNPAKALKAKTIGDSTFIVNQTREVQENSYPEHIPTYEAFVRVKTADYGKYYRIKVGSEAVERTATEATGVAAKAASTLLYGNSTASATATSRPVCKIRAKKKGGHFNSYLIRLMQNWAYERDIVQVNDAFGLLASSQASLGNAYKDLLADDVTTSGGKYLESSKQDLRKIHAGLQLDSKQNVVGSLKAVTQDLDNERVALHYSTSGAGNLFIWVNFYWAKHNDKVTSNLTTVGDVKNAIAQAGGKLSEEWEVVLCDNAGVAADEAGYDSSTVSQESWLFLDSELGHVPTTHTVNVTKNGTERKAYSGKQSYEDNNKEYRVGLDYIVRAFGKSVDQHGGGDKDYVKQGLQSPSTPTDRLHRDRSFTSGGAGTASQTRVSNLNNTVYDGEFYYKTPIWTGKSEDQQAIGTERIAEVLGSNALIINGNYHVRAGTGKLSRADGRTLQEDHDQYTNAFKEEAIGLTFNRAAVEVDTLTASSVTTTLNTLFTKDVAKDKFLTKFSSTAGETLKNLTWEVTQLGNVISIRNAQRVPFEIQVSDDLGGAGLDLTYFEVSEETELPSICRHGHVVRVIGHAREEADDYYLQFVADKADSSQLRHGRWEECVGYNTAKGLVDETMPVMLQRRFKSDGSKEFVLKHCDWNYRVAGDEHTNPTPSFVGNFINDVFLFKNRLGFISGESVILSEAGEYFNFFRTTVASFLDSAPIDVTLASEKVSKLHSALTYSDRLILFSRSQQFSLQGAQYLSPKTVSVTPTTDFLNTGVTPVLSGNSVFFAFPRTNYGGVAEYFLSKEQLDSMEAQDVTSHAPKYIKGNILKMASCSSENVLAVLTDNSGEALLYVYKYFLNNNQKTQSAWFSYKTGDAASQILSIEFIKNTLYMIIKRGSLVFIEKITFEDDQIDASMDYEVLLDRRVDKADTTINGSTSITMPAGYTITSSTRLVTDTGVQYSSSTTGTGVVFTPQTISDTPSAVSVPTNNFFIGDPYTMEYVFSQPFLKSAKATETGRYQIQRGILEYANARSFTVDVVHNPKMSAPNKNTVTNTYANDALHSLLTGTSELQEGFFKFGVQERNDRLQIKIQNSTPYPSDFLSMDYEAIAYSRGSRWNK